MTTNAIALIGMLWWACALFTLTASSVATLCFPRPRRVLAAPKVLSPVTVIVPVKELDACFERAQSSLFSQSYPGLEILIASAEQQSPALVAAQRVQQCHPDVTSRIVHSTIDRAASPKLNNLWLPVAEARSDLILTKDSNVLLAPGDVDRFVRHCTGDVGLVSAIPIVTEPQSFPAWVEAAMINGSFARLLMLARALGMGFGCGKVMLFRRSDVDRSGGFQGLAWALGEDAALTDAVTRLGLRTVLADRLTLQPLGRRRWQEVWNRQLRWRLIWRVQVPAVFVGALFCSALLASVAGAAAAPAMGQAPWSVAAATLVFWFLVETLLSMARGWAVSMWSPFAFLGRELLDIFVWLRALTTSEVAWAGATYRAGKPDSVEIPTAGPRPAFEQDAGVANDRL